MNFGLYVTGTDTGIGKTLASGALLHALRGHGLRAAGMKPAAGAFTSDEFGRGAALAVVSEAVGSDEWLALLKAVSLFVCAFEARERFSVGVAMLREIDAEEFSGPSRRI